jgi:hypothetical protein
MVQIKLVLLMANVTLNTEGQSVTFVYVDSTQGWINTMDSTSNVRLLPAFVTATGGTITCCGDYKIHTFTGPGTFTVTCAGNPLGSNTVDYLVVAGGGGAAGDIGGGGGAGGFRLSNSTCMPSTFNFSFSKSKWFTCINTRLSNNSRWWRCRFTFR